MACGAGARMLAPPVSREGVIELARCPDCRSPLARVSASQLKCQGCGRDTAIVDGIPRFVHDEDFKNGEDAGRTRASFGYEWTHFSDWHPSGQTIRDYFSTFTLEWL